MNEVIIEYPKMLYKGDDYLIVNDAKEQAAAIKKGWRLTKNG